MKENKNHKTGKMLRVFRLRAGLSQKDVGRILGVTYQQVQKYENGSNGLSAESLLDLSRLYNVSPETLMGAGEHRRVEVEMDDDTARICRRLCSVNDRTLKRKIIAVIDVLTG